MHFDTAIFIFFLFKIPCGTGMLALISWKKAKKNKMFQDSNILFNMFLYLVNNYVNCIKWSLVWHKDNIWGRWWVKFMTQNNNWWGMFAYNFYSFSITRCLVRHKDIILEHPVMTNTIIYKIGLHSNEWFDVPTIMPR